MAGDVGFGPTNDGIKIRCLTAWLIACVTVGSFEPTAGTLKRGYFTAAYDLILYDTLISVTVEKVPSSLGTFTSFS